MNILVNMVRYDEQEYSGGIVLDFDYKNYNLISSILLDKLMIYLPCGVKITSRVFLEYGGKLKQVIRLMVLIY